MLSANVGLLADLRLVERHGAEGIGLFRTELLALAHRGAPPEDEQEILYERVARAMNPRPVTIRTLDLGGDKAVPNLGLEAEENPQLGCRSVRLTMRHEELMRAQLRAILRASDVGNVRLLLPMISSLDELREVKRLLGATQDELARRGFHYDNEIPVGIMIEVPSAALIADVAGARVRLLQHRHQRPHPVHARRRPRQRGDRAPVPPAAPGGALADRRERARRRSRRHPDLGVRRDGEQSARRAAARRVSASASSRARRAACRW